MCGGVIMKFFLVTVFFVLSAVSTVAQVHKHGTLLNDEVWSLMDSPIFISDHLIVEEGKTLIIKRGVTVYVNSRPDDPIKIIIRGGLRVDGHKDGLVTITTRGRQTTNSQWHGILFDNSNDAFCRIRGLVVENAYYGLHIVNSSFTVNNSIFRNNRVGVRVDGHNEMVFYNSVFDKNQDAGILISEGRTIVMSNIFINNAYGILGGIPERVNAIVRYNNFWNNAHKNVWNTRDRLIGIPLRENDRKVMIDMAENIIADPIFIGSLAEREAIKNDLKNAEIDTNRINDKGFIENFLQRRVELKEAQRYETGPYRLSRYSPLINAGPPYESLINEDGSRNTIGFYGGPYFLR